MSTFYNKDIPELSLDALKTAIQVAKASSPEREDLITDLEYIADTIEKTPTKAIECNQAMFRKYPAICNVTSKYQLRIVSQEQLMLMSEKERIVVLHRIAHYLKDNLNTETIKVKGQVFVEEVSKSALGYAAKQLLSE